MSRRYHDLLFTPAVEAVQAREGSLGLYGTRGEGVVKDAALGAREQEFLEQRDSFYLASNSASGFPYLQHRGGPAGFVRLLGEHRIGWPEYRGNKQYITTGNVAGDARVSLFFMDYSARRRLKIIGTLGLLEREQVEAAGDALDPGIERLAIVDVVGFDWNCPQYITPRFTTDEIARATEPLMERIAALEAEVRACRDNGGSAALHDFGG